VVYGAPLPARSSCLPSHLLPTLLSNTPCLPKQRLHCRAWSLVPSPSRMPPQRTFGKIFLGESQRKTVSIWGLTLPAQSRFILNVPDEELETVERICFQVEQAYVFRLSCSVCSPTPPPPKDTGSTKTLLETKTQTFPLFHSRGSHSNSSPHARF
jgi:hypothetical protein